MRRTLIVADDHPIFRDGVRRLLKRTLEDVEIVEAATFADVLTKARQDEPELFILDLQFPGFEIPAGFAVLRALFPRSSILVVSMTDDDATIDAVLSGGADGFVSKVIHPKQMAEAVREVLEGHLVRLAGPAPSDFHTEEEPSTFKGLTRRQEHVLKLLTMGKSNKEIALALQISPFTVRIHVTAILRALQAPNRAAAAVVGRDLGY